MREMNEQIAKQGFWAYYLGGLCVRMSNHPLFLFAGGLAFATLLCLVPSVFLIFFALEAVLDPTSMTYLINRAVEILIPYEEQAAYLKDALSSRISGVVEFKEAYGISGLVILLLSVSGLFSSMRTLLNTIFQASEHEHNFVAKMFKEWPVAVDKLKDAGTLEHRVNFLRLALPAVVDKIRDLAMVLLVLGAFLLSVLLLPILAAVIDVVLSPLHSYMTYIYELASLAIIFAVFLGLYWLVPDQQPRIKVLAIGAFWAALLWKLAEWLFGYYLSHFASIWYLYGAYVLAVAVALWLYFAAIIFIAGAEIAQLCHEKRTAGP